MGNEGSKTKKGSVDSHIETAAKMGVLNLSNRKLEMVPMKVAQCVNLRSLDLSNNLLTDVSALKNLQNLQKLNISNNRLQSISAVLVLKKLQSLDASNNSISMLPSILGQRLRDLDLSNNRISVLDGQFVTKLDSLNLQNNALSVIPENFHSDSLVQLNCNNNRLTKLNADVFAKCSRLKVLRVANNQLQVFEFTQNFLENSQVSTLEYSNNKFIEKAFKELEGYESYENRRTQMMRKKD